MERPLEAGIPSLTSAELGQRPLLKLEPGTSRLRQLVSDVDALRARALRALTPDTHSVRWRDVGLRAVKETINDRIPRVAAGITFFALLAIFPAINAFVSVFGLVAGGKDAQALIESVRWILPGGAVSVVGQDIVRVAHVQHTTLGLNFAISLIISLWSANAGAKAMFDGLNVAYEVQERRGFARLTFISLVLTLGAILVAVILTGLSLVASQALNRLGPGEVDILALLRWPLAFVIVAGALSGLYCVGPSRQCRVRWVTPGSLLASAAWLVSSFVFSLYVARFGQFDRTYGALGDAVGFMTWIWISTTVVLFGAELNAEIEQTHQARSHVATSAGEAGAAGSSALGSAPRTSAPSKMSAFTDP